MKRRGHRADGGKTAWVVGAMLLLGLAACHAFWDAPEGRALDFIEALVTAPADAQKLRDIANVAPDRNPEDLVDDLSARVALDFLRAKQTQGITLKFDRADNKRMDAGRRAVTIRVAYPQPGTQSYEKIRFQVLVEKDEQGRWRIARVTGGN
jgi:hypothetical protein